MNTQKPESVTAAADGVLLAWRAYLVDASAFDELAEAIERLAAARRGRVYRLNTQRAALKNASSVSVLDLTRQTRNFADPGED